MEIFLRVEDERRSHLGDVEVRVEPSHTVRDVADAVARFLGLDRQPGFQPGFVVSRSGTGPLIDGQTMAEARVLSGQTLIIGRVWPEPEGRVGELVLVVASGPDAGMSLSLPPGSWSVGRDDGCDLTLSDPQVSRRHLRFTVDGNDQVTVEVLAEDRNEVRSGGQAVVGDQPVEIDETLRLGASSLVIRRRPPIQQGLVDAFGQVPFHRTPFFPAPVQQTTVDAIKDMPAKPEKSRFAYLSALLPVLMGVSFAVLANNPRYLMFAAFSPLMVIGNYFEQRRRSGNKFRESVERFNAALGVKTGEVSAALADERQRRFGESPDVAGLRNRAANRALDLWVRDRQAYNFLSLRVGMGDLPTAVEVKYSDSGDPEFRDQVVEAYGETASLTDVPVNLDLAELGVVGLIGKAAETSALASSLAVQAAALHSPEDLVVLAATAHQRSMSDWLKWLPHSRSSSSPLAGAHLVESKTQADALISELLAEALRRLDFSGDPVTFPWLLLVLDRALEPDAAIVSRLLDLCPGVGMSVVWLTDTEERVPRQAQAVVHCLSPLTGELSRVSFTDPERDDRLVDIERVTPEFSREASQALAPLRDASSANAATAIPRVVPLFTALGIEAIDPGWVAAQWQTDRGYSLQGPIGYTDSGPLILDIVEHGPHGLIGGTSGAGKSELVMSMVAGLIAYNPPTRINFLFIDYKGGASSDLFKDVPHTVGYVTNLDGLLAMRALTSLRAELNRRMNLMQGKAKDLAEMLDKFPDEAPPSLVIVVDEFATLVQEIPDFVAGIVDIAQRGRSLGIHLMLATQRPSGSVNDNIKANTNLRISLRMLDGGESTSVIGTADAALIPAPLKGRGYARMGPGELIAFQSAWSGAPLLAEAGAPPVAVRTFSPSPTAAAGQAPTASTDPNPNSNQPQPQSDRTQIDATLDAVVAAGQQLGYRRGRPPWLETLPEMLSIEAVRRIDGLVSDSAASQRKPGVRIVFGMVDDPATQSQYPAVVDLAKSGGMIVSGTGGAGKSTLLKTMAISGALDDSALGGGHLTIFAIDFASRELGALNRLPQCGGVAGSDDMEAVTRIIALLHTEFERRRQALAEAVARSQATPDQTSVLILIDGLEALIQTMEQGPGAGGLAQYYSELTKVITDGRQVGMYPIITTSRHSVVRASMSSAISDRLTLRQADAQGYAETGISAADAKGLDLVPGQGFIKGSTLVQVAKLTADSGTEWVDDQTSDEDRERIEREQLVQLAESLSGKVDPHLETAPLPHALGLLPSSDPLRPVIGMADLTCAPFTLDMTHNNVSIIGDPRSGRSTALATIGRQAAAAGAEVWVLAGPGSALLGLDEASQACFAEGPERQEFLERLVELAAPSASAQPGLHGGEVKPRLLLIDDIDLLPENDRGVVGPLETLLGTVRYAAAGSKPRGFSSSPIVQQVRACRSVIYLRPHDGREAHEVVGVPVPWHPGLPMVEGRGFVVVDRLPVIVQLSNAFLDSDSNSESS
ncbi:MAG: FtsK/SpoIIIE domain-containing protein [Acidimicrobiales bacterium]